MLKGLSNKESRILMRLPWFDKDFQGLGCSNTGGINPVSLRACHQLGVLTLVANNAQSIK